MADDVAAAADEPAPLPRTGDAVAEFAPLETWITGFMKRYGVPGGQLALARDGKLVYSRGFGYADRDEKNPVEPTSLFRIASVSKPITAVAVLQLVDQGKLKLTDPIDGILKIEPHRAKDIEPDQRWPKITVAHCLAHTGGWDRDKSYDPMFAYERVAQALGVTHAVGPPEIIRYMRGQPLDFAPGERYAYSNFGYSLLGRVIEKLSGEDYATYVSNTVFAPLGLTAPRMGRSLADQRAEKEVTYYTVQKDPVTPAAGPHAFDEKHKTPLAYGGWNQEALDAHGGWIASAQDLVLFGAAVDDPAAAGTRTLLKPESIRAMFAPAATVKQGDGRGHGRVSYGLGWTLGREDNDDARPIRAHGGALPCTAASLVKLHDGINIAALFNLGQDDKEQFIGRGLDGQLIAALRTK